MMRFTYMILVACLFCGFGYSVAHAGQKAELHCDRSVLFFDDSMSYVFSRHPSGVCIYSVSAPWDHREGDALGKAGAELLKASRGEIADIEGRFVDGLSEVISEHAMTELLRAEGGETFVGKVNEGKGEIAACVRSALSGETYKGETQGGLQLTCSISNEGQPRFILAAEFGGFDVEFSTAA